MSRRYYVIVPGRDDDVTEEIIDTMFRQFRKWGTVDPDTIKYMGIVGGFPEEPLHGFIGTLEPWPTANHSADALIVAKGEER